MHARSPRVNQLTVIPVEMQNVTKHYPGDVAALSNVSFSVKRGELVGLLGPSGCGKSTLLNLIGCIDLPSSGRVLIGGQQTSSLADDDLTRLRRESIGTIFQFFNLLPTLTLAENVGLPLALQKADRREAAARVATVLERVDLTNRSNSYPATVSGGQLQRAAIARAIVHRPAIVLADEPTGNLDSRNGTIVLQLLRELADSGQTILIATHSAEAAAICDRRIHLLDGAIASIA